MKKIILRLILLILLLCVAAIGVAEETADLTPADITASLVMPETGGDPGQEQGTQPVPEDAADGQNGSADLLKSENGTQSEEPDGGSAQAKGMTETQEENADTISETQPEITAEADAGYEPSEVAVFSAEVSIRVSPAGEIPENTMIILKALVSNATMDYTLRWEQHDPAKDQPGASAKWTVIGEENELRMTASMSLNIMEHRLHVTGADGTELFVPVPALVIKPAPEDTKLPADRPEAPETEKQEEIVSETDTEPPEPADEISADEETSDVATIDEPMIDPALNRRTENGVHMIGDMPVSRSVFGSDLLNPVMQDRTRDIIALQSGLPIFDSSKPYSGESGPSIEIAELNTDEAIMAYASEHASAPLAAYAGCAGFARALGTLFSLKRGTSLSARIHLPLAVFTASLNSVNMEQMRRGEAAGLYSCRFSDALEEEPDIDRMIKMISGRNPGAMIETSRTPAQGKELSRLGEQLGLDTRRTGERIVLNLGCAAKKLVDSGFDGTLCLFGGDCVSAALSRMGCRGLLPVREIEPGVVVSRAFLPAGELTLVTKSGGFGSPDVIEKLIKTAEEKA